MGEQIDASRDVVVLDVAAYLIEAESVICKQEAAKHARLWREAAERLWPGIFAIVAGEQRRDHPPMPAELPDVLRESRLENAAIYAVALVELEINPLIAGPGGVIAVDARATATPSPRVSVVC